MIILLVLLFLLFFIIIIVVVVVVVIIVVVIVVLLLLECSYVRQKQPMKANLRRPHMNSYLAIQKIHQIVQLLPIKSNQRLVK